MKSNNLNTSKSLLRNTTKTMAQKSPPPSSQERSFRQEGKPLVRSASREPLLALQTTAPSLQVAPQAKSQYPASEQSSKQQSPISSSTSPRGDGSSNSGSGYRADDEDSSANPTRMGSWSSRSSYEKLDICDRLNNTVFCRDEEGCVVS